MMMDQSSSSCSSTSHCLPSLPSKASMSGRLVHVDFPEVPVSLLESLNQQRLEGQLCDLSIQVQGQEFRAHRCVLAASSPYFHDQVLLKNVSSVVLPSVMDPLAFESVLGSAYTGRLSMLTDEIVNYLTVGSVLQMWHVVDKCSELLREGRGQGNSQLTGSSRAVEGGDQLGNSQAGRQGGHCSSRASENQSPSSTNYFSPREAGSSGGSSVGAGGLAGVLGGAGQAGGGGYGRAGEDSFTEESEEMVYQQQHSSSLRKRAGRFARRRKLRESEEGGLDSELEDSGGPSSSSTLLLGGSKRPAYVQPSIMPRKQWVLVKKERPAPLEDVLLTCEDEEGSEGGRAGPGAGALVFEGGSGGVGELVFEGGAEDRGGDGALVQTGAGTLVFEGGAGGRGAVGVPVFEGGRGRVGVLGFEPDRERAQLSISNVRTLSGMEMQPEQGKRGGGAGHRQDVLDEQVNFCESSEDYIQFETAAGLTGSTGSGGMDDQSQPHQHLHHQQLGNETSTVRSSSGGGGGVANQTGLQFNPQRSLLPIDMQGNQVVVYQQPSPAVLQLAGAEHGAVQVSPHAQDGGKIFMCHCGKTFTHKSMRDRHVNMHLNLRPFDCPVCTKKFKMKHHLTEHMKTHTGLKPYNCDTCSKKFMWRDSFMRHRSHCERRSGAGGLLHHQHGTAAAAAPGSGLLLGGSSSGTGSAGPGGAVLLVSQQSSAVNDGSNNGGSVT
ncbi:zinc finger and BTB domain-containing protein 22-like [Acipenser ruthenus]|uniref:zinc finger and BTB domain-containing protein 22-like n=1 Tax=Acipenser ruthenus TaxID=7906 RepID=UPI002740B5D3|nr:zinc finger and BTB domain-containing protein 22-like [Acipenser ruthenus]